MTATAEIRPRLRPDLIRHPGAGSVVVLQDPVSERFVRLDAVEHRFLLALDGTRTLEEARAALRDQGRLLTTVEAAQLVAKASEFGLLLGTPHATAAHQAKVASAREEMQSGRGFTRLLFFYLPLVSPDRFLERTQLVYHLVANRWTALLMAVLAPGAAYLTLMHLPNVEREYLYFFHWKGLLLLWSTMMAAKVLHELAHAYVAKSYGLRVPTIGVAFMVFFPFLYCDTTHAWQLPSRLQRMAVSAAGILAEGVLGVIATWVWAFTRPGILHSLAFYFMAVSLLSTVLVNANPLMKRDGYFVLIDLLDMPNLARKGAEQVQYVFSNQVLGIRSVTSPAASIGEAWLFFLFGIGSRLYGFAISLSLVGILYLKFDKMIGAVLAVLAIFSFVAIPGWKTVTGLVRRRREIHPRPSGLIACGVAAALGIAAVGMPLTTRSVYPCMLVPSRVQDLSIPLGATVTEVKVREGSTVRRGDLLFALDGREIELELEQRRLHRDILQREYELSLLDAKERGRAPIKAVEIFQVEDAIAHTQAKLDIARGGIVAPFDGTVTRLDPRMQPGFRPGEGSRVGSLEAIEEMRIHALVPAEDRHRVILGQEVDIWLPVPGTPRYVGNVVEVRAYSEDDLRRSPFSSALGGELATERRDSSHKETPLEARFICVARLVGPDRPQHAGMTGRMAVPQPPRSLYRILVDGLIQTFNRESVI